MQQTSALLRTFMYNLVAKHQMNTLEHLSIVHACTDLVSRYAFAVNNGNTENFINLFSPDSVWQRPNCPALIGRHEISAFISAEFSKARTIRHVNGAVLIDVIDESNACGWSQTTVYHHIGNSLTLPIVGTIPEMVVEYQDSYQRVNEHWFFSHRSTSIIFIAPINQ